MKRKMSTSDSSSVDTSICKKIKQDIDTSDDDDDEDDDDEIVSRKPTRSTTCVSFAKLKIKSLQNSRIK